ncbi:type II toxin-antitoxin system VapC family toxin [Mesorhizobium sp. CAU 1732]|uniref:type II toxin-antitoxin system VapC family toxin n=1 Tax=Mesorhizobium sp. CAU 1732 TaxID=3140358 RepID=UPI003261C256
MIVLDTNVISELQKAAPDGAVASWFASVGIENVFLCVPVLMEQSFGAERFFLRTKSSRYLDILEGATREFADRMLVLDGGSSRLAGTIRARLERAGRQMSIGDAMIAAICIAHGATLATRNVRDFDGLDLKLVNPFEPMI